MIAAFINNAWWRETEIRRAAAWTWHLTSDDVLNTDSQFTLEKEEFSCYSYVSCKCEAWSVVFTVRILKWKLTCFLNVWRFLSSTQRVTGLYLDVVSVLFYINMAIFSFLVSEATSAPSPILHRDLSLKHTLTSCLSQPQASRLEPNLHPAAQFSTSVCPLSGETNTKTDSPSNSSFTVLFLHEGWFVAALTPHSLRLASNEIQLYRGQKHIPNISSFLRRCKD